VVEAIEVHEELEQAAFRLTEMVAAAVVEKEEKSTVYPVATALAVLVTTVVESQPSVARQARSFSSATTCTASQSGRSAADPSAELSDDAVRVEAKTT